MFNTYFRCGYKIKIFVMSWNICLINNFLLRFHDSAVGSDFHQFVFSAVGQSFLVYLQFILSNISELVLNLVAACVSVFDCAFDCVGFGSDDDELLFHIVLPVETVWLLVSKILFDFGKWTIFPCSWSLKLKVVLL